MVDCSNETPTNETQPLVTSSCALFDFMIFTIIGGMFCILGLSGNILAYFVLSKDQSKTATFYLLKSLAVSDSVVIISAIPLYILDPIHLYTGYLSGYHKFYINFLPYLYPCFLIPFTLSIFLTVLVSLSRYYAVCRPFSSLRVCLTESARKYVIYIAMFSIVYNIPRFFEYQKVVICDGPNRTVEIFETSAFGDNLAYRIVYAIIIYFIVNHGGPLLCLALLNYKLIQALQSRMKRRALMGKGANSGGVQQDTTLILVVVIFVFLLCHTPTFIDQILWTVLDKSARDCGKGLYYYTAISDVCVILNSSGNFYVYILTSKKFRLILAQLCCKYSFGNTSTLTEPEHATLLHKSPIHNSNVSPNMTPPIHMTPIKSRNHEVLSSKTDSEHVHAETNHNSLDQSENVENNKVQSIVVAMDV